MNTCIVISLIVGCGGLTGLLVASLIKLHIIKRDTTPPSKHPVHAEKRPKKIPPHVSIKWIRTVAGLTQTQVCNRVNEQCTKITLTKGALSAIESGTRGVSPLMLTALARAYGIDDDALTTNYIPHRR